jgi:hypothetical protein
MNAHDNAPGISKEERHILCNVVDGEIIPISEARERHFARDDEVCKECKQCQP